MMFVHALTKNFSAVVNILKIVEEVYDKKLVVLQMLK